MKPPNDLARAIAELSEFTASLRESERSKELRIAILAGLRKSINTSSLCAVHGGFTSKEALSAWSVALAIALKAIQIEEKYNPTNG